MAALLAVVLVSSCHEECFALCKAWKFGDSFCSGVAVTFEVFTGGLARGAGQDNFVAVTAGNGGAGSAGAGAPIDLWAPFELSVAFGMFDPTGGEQGPFGAIGCIRAENLDLTTSFGLCAEVEPGRMVLTPDATTGPLIGTLVLGGATLAELRIAADLDSLDFYGRELGATEWTLVDTVAFTDQAEPLRPWVAAALVPERSQVGFDLLHFAGAPPPDPTPEQTVAYAVQLAVADALEAVLLLDGPIPDTAGSAALVASARDHLSDAETGASALGKPGKRVAKRIRKSSAQFAKAQAQLGEGNVEKGLKTYGKAGKSAVQALDGLLPDQVF
ncbi:MAG TPA: hypothetical protein VHQ66_03195 [Myxococcota bacterium]|nr:hypothetical protein [Myxococcota bacterium]